MEGKVCLNSLVKLERRFSNKAHCSWIQTTYCFVSSYEADNTTLICRAPKTVLDFFKPKPATNVNGGPNLKLKAESPRQHPPRAIVKPEENGVAILLSDSDDGLPQPKRRKSSPEAENTKEKKSRFHCADEQNPQQSASKAGRALAL